jgi:cysteinyl-tRNA synthetase
MPSLGGLTKVMLRFYNTLRRAVEDFNPINPGAALMYGCGPTVYNFAHIGNLRTYVFEDVLRRALEYSGFRVTHVMNITDVGHLTDDADDGEDKMLKSSRESGMSVWDIARFYTEAFFRDTAALNIESPTITCKATEHIDDMIKLIRRIEENGYTYTAGGNLYFSVDRFPSYGALALLDKQELKAGARIEVDDNKRNPRDFVLWFTNSKFEHQTMVWDSPWGRGYPGWHIECSAMSMRYLGEQFDIHCGGIDHIPVHHTNEIAQSEAATGKKWVNYWLHGEFLVMNKGKMAKSAGNFITLKSLTDSGFDPLDYRFFCLGAHYRAQLQFHYDALESARAARLNMSERVRALCERTKPAALGSVGDAAGRYLRDFREHLSDDLSMPRCLSDAWGLLKDAQVSDGEKLAVILDMDRVLGLRLAAVSAPDELDAESAALIAEREAARAEKDYKRADELRNALLAKGIVIKDTAAGTQWSKK